MKVMCSWSGGKDSCFALMKTIEEEGNLVCLMNMMNENGEISRSHGIHQSILKEQAERLNVPIVLIPATWGDYETEYVKTLKNLVSKHQFESVVFGDIDIEQHKEWEEKVCSMAEVKATLPLWKGNRKVLVENMIESDVKAIITSCNAQLGVEFLGKEINYDTIDLLEEKGVDVCGENGEYHTLVVDCPLFSSPINLPKHKKVVNGEYCFLDWELL